MSVNPLVTRWVGGLALLLSSTAPAYAADGCKVLLCFAGNWRDISECRPEVEQALKDQAKGKGWPTCQTTQADSSVQTENSIVPITIYGPACPYWARDWAFDVNPNYDTFDNKVYGTWRMTCKVTQIMAVSIDGQPWKKSYVMPDGSSVDEWLPAAVAAMPDMDFTANSVDTAQAAWVSAGSPTTKPSWTLPANYVDMAAEAYFSCYPYSQACNWFKDGTYTAW